MAMHMAKNLDTCRPPALCNICSIPLDAEFFDESGVAEPPGGGQAVVLARFELPPQYCGVLQYFAQYTDQQAKSPDKIETPGIEWVILSNNRPLYPYLTLGRIVNPWGFGAFPISIRLDENATIEFVVRSMGNVASGNGDAIKRVGGRIVGRYWYNLAYGDAVRGGS